MNYSVIHRNRAIITIITNYYIKLGVINEIRLQQRIDPQRNHIFNGFYQSKKLSFSHFERIS